MKMDAAEKAKKAVEMESLENEELSEYDDGDDGNDYDESLQAVIETTEETPRVVASELDRLAAVAATAWRPPPSMMPPERDLCTPSAGCIRCAERNAISTGKLA